MIERSVVVAFKEGLHARPAALLAKLAKGFDARINVVKNGRAADAKSVAKLMLLAVQEGERILLRAEGSEAEAAVERLDALVSAGDAVAAPCAAVAAPCAVVAAPCAAVAAPCAAVAAPCAASVRGAAGNTGVAVGPAFVHLPEAAAPPVRFVSPDEIPAEAARLAAAFAAVQAAFEAQAAQAEEPTERDILKALCELTQDPALADAAQQRVAHGQDAPSAAWAAGMAVADEFAASDSEYFRARAQDVRDVARHLVDALLGVSAPDLAVVAEDCVLIAGALSAVEFARLPKRRVRGVVLLEGGPTSHVAIMARAFGLPLVLLRNADPARLRSARFVAMDGAAGTVALDPDEATRRRFEDQMRRDADARRALRHLVGAVARTRNGQVVDVAANIGTVAETAIAREHGAMGVGLFRTELLFMQGRRLPTEEEQYRAYAAVLDAMAPHPVVIRTLDIGGDKPLPGVAAEPEDNPFLGWRGIRMCLDRPDLFKPQLRALLRAARHGRLRVMFPMISDIGEFRAGRALLDQCAVELSAEGVETGVVQLGIMVETPAAALCADALAAEVAFFSIGTNDLTQYVMAADRTHRRLAHLGRADHPAVLRLIRMTCDAARARGIPVSVCGEMAADPALIPRLVEWGVTGLSMSAPAIPQAKQVILQL